MSADILQLLTCLTQSPDTPKYMLVLLIVGQVILKDKEIKPAHKCRQLYQDHLAWRNCSKRSPSLWCSWLYSV